MNQLTIRGFDEELVRTLKRLARERGISLNKAAVLLLREGAGLNRGKNEGNVVGDSLDSLIGAWSKEEEQEILSAVASLDTIDESLW